MPRLRVVACSRARLIREVGLAALLAVDEDHNVGHLKLLSLSDDGRAETAERGRVGEKKTAAGGERSAKETACNGWWFER